jgi:hypothetical protein
MLSKLCARKPAWIASLTKSRLIPHIPPTPFSVNPKPSWIGVNCTLMTIKNE